MTLSTVHAAKGLEWPCVVLADAGAQPRSRDDAFLLDPDGRFAWKIEDPLEGVARTPGGFAARAEAERAAASEESLRLLYVALTRAEERLVVAMSVAGRNKNGSPHKLAGWGKQILEALDAPWDEGVHEVRLDDAVVTVSVESPAAASSAASEPAQPAAPLQPSTVLRPWSRRYGARDLLEGGEPAPDDATAAAAAAHWARVRDPVEALGRTPYVVTISDLLAFAESPEAYYRERVLGASALPAAGIRAERDDPASGSEHAGDDAAREDAREHRLDEGQEVLRGVAPPAPGRAVHAVLERVGPDDEAPPARLLDAALAAEPRLDAAAVRPAAAAMVARFLSSRAGADLRAALRAGRDVRREVPFHARIRFPAGAAVGDYDSLLVKGTVDLWIDREGGAAPGPWVLDHKTNSPEGRFGTVEALRDHYAPQLRLYALAAERVLGRDVAGAGLLLLDPAWGTRCPEVEVPVDVSGEKLLETRRLCLAYARAMHEDRFPERWEELIP